ncbi:MAG: PAS domain-containing sensor histidine kinase, partial [Tepidiformaceae bacterium]
YFNDGAVRIFGYTVDEVMGRPLEILLPASARTVHRRHVERFVESSVTARRMGERQEISGRRKNGEEFPAEAAIAKLRSGNEVFASVVLRDITERKYAERRQQFLVEVSELLASSLELNETLSSLARLWIPGVADFTVVEMIHRGESYHLRAVQRTDGAVDESPITVTAGTRPNRVANADVSGLQRVSVVSVEAALDAIPSCYRDDATQLGARTAFLVSLVRGGESFGRVLAFNRHPPPLAGGDLSLIEDLARRASMATENACLHEEIRWALHARDETLSVVSHDLRNPVNAVKMLAGALLRSGAAERVPPAVADQVRVIQSAAQQMDTLIQDLLDMSRADAGRFAVDPKSVSAGALIRDALRTLGPLAQDKGVAIVIAWSAPLPAVQVDPERITQVISNIVGNAIKFTPSGGEILVSAEEHPDAVLVTVTDTGPGIPAEHLIHIFDRYWQLSGGDRGVGLGLPIAKAIVEAHGGRIWAESVEGEGATFHFTLRR